MSKTEDNLEVVRGSGNVFNDLGFADANVLQFKANVAAQILAVLEAEKITVREAHERTGFAAADFSRVRQAKVRNFTLDRLVTMLTRLVGEKVEVQVEVKMHRRLRPQRREASLAHRPA